MADQIDKPITASANLRKGLSTPGAKVAIGVIALSIVGLGGFGVSKFRAASGPSAGSAQAGGFDVTGGKPRGATDAVTAGAVGNASDNAAKTAASQGQSYGGPFVFEGAPDGSKVGLGPSANSNTGVGAAAPRDPSGDVIAALRKRASEYDAADEGNASRDVASATGNNNTGGGGQRTSSGSDSQAASTGQGSNYGLDQKGFDQVSSQLAGIGTKAFRYESTTGGVLSRASASPASPATSVAETKLPISANPSQVSGITQGASRVIEQIVARAGSTCAAAPDSAINTDVTLPVFASLLDCGDLTGSKVKGSIIKSIDDFTVRFTTIYPDPSRRLKISGSFDAVAVSISNDGAPAIADDVDNHWWTRLASSALLRLAKTEQQFLAARGSTTTNNGTSSSTTVEPVSSSQRRDARVAGVIEGTLEVITRDVSVGVNRQATMTTKKASLIGVQFLDDVKVVRLE